MLQRLRGSAWLSSEGPTESIFSASAPSPPPPPITAPLGACNAVIQLRRSEPRATV